tara:strand:+ start:73 stop:315 length:243 start_codon:yes stop_codon:yes gene_type:complete
MSLRPVEAPPATSSLGGELSWADLTETEKSAASLGVDPGAFKPISFMNAAHHEQLLKNNLIGENLAKSLEAYKHVANGAA